MRPHSLQADVSDLGRMAAIFSGDSKLGVVNSHAVLKSLDLATWSNVTAQYHYADPNLPGNSPDQPYSVTDASGQAQYFRYDANNWQIESWTHWVDPAGIETDKYVFRRYNNISGCRYEAGDCISDSIYCLSYLSVSYYSDYVRKSGPWI